MRGHSQEPGAQSDKLGALQGQEASGRCHKGGYQGLIEVILRERETECAQTVEQIYSLTK